jgi:phosphoribosylformylglycinamidine (FGAM) synthase PurS component
MGTTSILNDTYVSSVEPLDVKNTLTEEVKKEKDPVSIEDTMKPSNHTEIKDLDASKIIEIMKESTKQLDQILIKMCEEKRKKVDVKSNTFKEEQKTEISAIHDHFQSKNKCKSLDFYQVCQINI